MKQLTLTVLLASLLSFNSHAIVIRHDKQQVQYQVPQTQYPSVVNLDFLTGTLIDSQWILTAAHGTPYMPSGQTITIAEQEYQVLYIVAHPQYDTDNLAHDIALLKLDRPVSNVASTPIYRETNEKLEHVWFVGRGDVGNGVVGIIEPTTDLHHAENIIEDVSDLWLKFDFDKPENQALPLEGISGPGDSGGPAFINTHSGLAVAGVSSHQRNNENGEGLYGVIEYYSRTSSQQTWIDQTIKKSNTELKKVALNRPSYKAIKTTDSEIDVLLGTYTLVDNSTLFIEPCTDGVCYRWADTTEQVAIFKATNNIWFTPQINRVFNIEYHSNGQVKQITLDDFNGQRILTKIAESQVVTLKNRIATRGRKLITHVEPIWPEHALSNKIQGSVTMSFSITTDGTVTNIKVVEATPKDVFEQASITALSNWRYDKLETPLHNILTKFDFSL